MKKTHTTQRKNGLGAREEAVFVTRHLLTGGMETRNALLACVGTEFSSCGYVFEEAALQCYVGRAFVLCHQHQQATGLYLCSHCTFHSTNMRPTKLSATYGFT